MLRKKGNIIGQNDFYESMANGYLSSETRSMIPTIVACLACVQLKEYPLNIIDIPSMLIEHDEDNILKIVTHREVSIDDVSYA